MALAGKVPVVAWVALLVGFGCTDPRYAAPGTTDAGDRIDAGSVDAGADASMAARDAGDHGAFDRKKLRLSIGMEHACGLFPDGTARCWGSNEIGQIDLGSGPFKDLACGDFHTCTIDEAGALHCVGSNSGGQRVSFPGPFVAVAAGDEHTCALDADGAVQCWGRNASQQLDAPAVAFAQITAGDEFACGIRKDDAKVQCWGSDLANRSSPPAGVSFASIDAGRSHVCGRTTDGKLLCWGENIFSGPPLKVTQVAAGNLASCALLEGGAARCWPDTENVPRMADGPFASVFAGRRLVCFVPEKGRVECIYGFGQTDTGDGNAVPDSTKLDDVPADLLPE